MSVEEESEQLNLDGPDTDVPESLPADSGISESLIGGIEQPTSGNQGSSESSSSSSKEPKKKISKKVLEKALKEYLSEIRILRQTLQMSKTAVPKSKAITEFFSFLSFVFF